MVCVNEANDFINKIIPWTGMDTLLTHSITQKASITLDTLSKSLYLSLSPLSKLKYMKSPPSQDGHLLSISRMESRSLLTHSEWSDTGNIMK